MTLTGKDAERVMQEARAKAQRVKAEQLAAAKAEAAARGKAPFDLAKLEAPCDTSRQGRVDPLEQRCIELERMYYVQFPAIMTLAEFAEKVNELNRW